MKAIEQLTANADTADYPWKKGELLVPLRTAIQALKETKAELNEDLLADIMAVVNAYYTDELRHWQENGEPEDHTYHALESLRKLILDYVPQPDPDYAAEQRDSYGVDAPNVIDP